MRGKATDQHNPRSERCRECSLAEQKAGEDFGLRLNDIRTTACSLGGNVRSGQIATWQHRLATPELL